MNDSPFSRCILILAWAWFLNDACCFIVRHKNLTAWQNALTANVQPHWPHKTLVWQILARIHNVLLLCTVCIFAYSCYTFNHCLWFFFKWVVYSTCKVCYTLTHVNCVRMEVIGIRSFLLGITHMNVLTGL